MAISGFEKVALQNGKPVMRVTTTTPSTVWQPVVADPSLLTEDAQCCCCYCNVVNYPFAINHGFKCLNSDYGSVGEYTTVQFDIGGTITHNGWWTFGSPPVYVCGAGVGGDPRGSWIFSLPLDFTGQRTSGTWRKRWLSIVCETPAFWYLYQMDVGFSASVLQCVDNVVIGQVYIQNFITEWAKPGPLPPVFVAGPLDTWHDIGLIAVNGNNVTLRVRNVTSNHRTTWYWEPGMHPAFPGSTDNVYCKPACNSTACLFKCGGGLALNSSVELVSGNWIRYTDTRSLTLSMTHS